MDANEVLKILKEITLYKMLHTDQEYRLAVKEVIAQRLWSELRDEDHAENEKYIDAVNELNELIEFKKVKVQREMLKTLVELHGNKS